MLGEGKQALHLGVMDIMRAQARQLYLQCEKVSKVVTQALRSFDALLNQS